MFKIDKCTEIGHNIYKGRLQRVCRTCDNERTKRRWKDPEYKKYHRDWMFKRTRSFRKIIDTEKDKPCMDCGIKYEPYIMQFDHRDGSDKKFTIGRKGGSCTEGALIEEIRKCDVVCANCHCRRTHHNLPKVLSRRKLKIYNTIYPVT